MRRHLKTLFTEKQMTKPKKLKKVSIKGEYLIELIHWARRYADRRCTFVPSEFNKIYAEIMNDYPFLEDHEFKDVTLYENGKFFPYAQDGEYDENTGNFDARSRIKHML